jgi:hypothetical protein
MGWPQPCPFLPVLQPQVSFPNSSHKKTSNFNAMDYEYISLSETLLLRAVILSSEEAYRMNLFMTGVQAREILKRRRGT